MKLHASGEDYLETILLLTRRNGKVRSIDIANELDFSKPSVSVAMKHLREQELIQVADTGEIILSPKGLEIAERIYERHELLSLWLRTLGVPEDIAAEDACKIEHVISAESFEAIKNYVANRHK
jgi:Mn-dependent DtxR family transcriptional regulator